MPTQFLLVLQISFPDVTLYACVCSHSSRVALFNCCTFTSDFVNLLFVKKKLMNHNSPYKAQSLGIFTHWWLWRFTPWRQQTHGGGQDGVLQIGFLCPTKCYWFLLVLTGINFQHLQTGRYYTDSKSWFIEKKNEELSYTETMISCQELSGREFLLSSLLSLTFSLWPLLTSEISTSVTLTSMYGLLW